MNKILLVFLILAINIHSVQGQIILTRDDFADPGEIFYSGAKYSNIVNVDIGENGPNKVWDFSMLISEEDASLAFLNPSKTEYGFIYPESNIAVSDGFDGYNYIQKTLTELLNVGYTGKYLTLDFKLKFTPAIKYSHFPLNYLDNFSSYSIGVDKVEYKEYAGVDSLKYTVIAELKDTVDGWGMISTPFGSYEALRIKEYSKITTISEYRAFDTWNIYETLTDYTRKYKWFAKDVGVPVLEIELGGWSGNVINNYQFYRGKQVLSNSHSDINKTKLAISPNPNNGTFTLDNSSSSDYSIEVIDTQGNKVYGSIVPKFDSKTEYTILKPGLYILKFASKESVFYKKMQIY